MPKPKKQDQLLPYDQVVTPESEPGMEAGVERAYRSDDPNVENEAAGAIVSDSAGGGICNACAHFSAPDQCAGFSGPLSVTPDLVAKCTAFRPTLGGMDQPDGFADEMVG